MKGSANVTKITDHQLYWLHRERITSHNGFSCNRRMGYDGSVCEGTMSIINGKLKYDGTCGEPCSFICRDAQALQDSINNVIQMDRLITEAKAKAC